MEFSDNFYSEVKEKSPGIHAFELLIDCYNRALYPEAGPMTVTPQVRAILPKVG